ncbi:uncharacterized protein LOC128715081 [Anopheles marshallii]|uniref:uncharacterized protein LOC128715081 n=1 Tax=Anopheles marshallii TaxID=1521116 RepID=UPI00237A5C59|nr:uncharacterized protein LOC128715081 [Anopheles marshallii]
MGSLNSKVSPSGENTPPSDHEPYLDPRSPTLYINRSPITQEQTDVPPNASITRGKDLTSVLTEPSAYALQTPNNLLPKRFQSIIDPRSPSTFNRTPLVIAPEDVANCSLTNVVSSLSYEVCHNALEEDSKDASFKDCDSQMPDLCNLQIEYDETAPIIEATTDAKEITIFEDAEVIPFVGNDPRSPSIAIARTPMVLPKHGNDEEATKQHNELQVENLHALEGDLKAEVAKQQHTPQQDPQENHNRGEQTPKKGKLTPRTGNRTPLGCMTNIGTVSNNIRKMALIGQTKQNMITDEQKLLPRNGNIGSAELNASAKQTNRSRIPKLRMS